MLLSHRQYALGEVVSVLVLHKQPHCHVAAVVVLHTLRAFQRRRPAFRTHAVLPDQVRLKEVLPLHVGQLPGHLLPVGGDLVHIQVVPDALVHSEEVFDAVMGLGALVSVLLARDVHRLFGALRVHFAAEGRRDHGNVDQHDAVRGPGHAANHLESQPAVRCIRDAHHIFVGPHCGCHRLVHRVGSVEIRERGGERGERAAVQGCLVINQHEGDAQGQALVLRDFEAARRGEDVSLHESRQFSIPQAGNQYVRLSALLRAVRMIVVVVLGKALRVLAEGDAADRRRGRHAMLENRVHALRPQVEYDAPG
eukprot:Colp12_sorted_trinity150504_noHs@19785